MQGRNCPLLSKAIRFALANVSCQLPQTLPFESGILLEQVLDCFVAAVHDGFGDMLETKNLSVCTRPFRSCAWECLANGFGVTLTKQAPDVLDLSFTCAPRLEFTGLLNGF